MERVQIRGRRTFCKKAPLSRWFTALVVDGALALLLTAFFLFQLGLPPLPGFKALGLLTLVILLTMLLPLIFFQNSLGYYLWKLKSADRGLSALLKRPYQIEKASWFQTAFRSTMSLTILLGSIFLTSQLILAHPLWLPGGKKHLARTDSTTEPNFLPTREWLKLPFFYLTGAWPQKIQGDPIFYTLPYEKGPPVRFIGRIQLKWWANNHPFQIELKGPKTVPLLPSEPQTNAPSSSSKRKLQKVRDCFAKPNKLPSLDCAQVRERLLRPHLKGLNPYSLQKKAMGWFHVRAQPKLGNSPQGIFFKYTSQKRTVIRFIILNHEGRQQSLILKGASQNAHFKKAKKLVKTILFNLRQHSQLQLGRGVASQILSEIDLRNIEKQFQNPSKNKLEKITRVHAALLSKISVRPSEVPAYYHLAGTSMLLMKKLKNEPSSNAQHWIAMLKQNPLSAKRYVEDINQDKKAKKMLKSLEMMANQARKF